MAQEIANLVANINAALKDLQGAKADVDAASYRRNLLSEAKKLVASLEDPSAAVWPRVFQVNVSVAIDAAWKMGIWDRLRDQETISLSEVVDLTGADEIMISELFSTTDCLGWRHRPLILSVRIFRQLTAAGILSDIPGPGYTLTLLGEPYLDPNHCAYNHMVLQEVIPSVLAMPHTLRARGYKAPTKDSGTPFMWANGEELWTFLGRYPERALNMVKGMKSLDTGSLSPSAFPFGEELGKLEIQDGEVAIVDIAGGQGHIMEHVRKQNPGIKGRFIVQDLPSTFEAVREPPAGVEFMSYDMFTPQPIRDAYVYHYRHIFHDWNDEDASRFLKQVVDILWERQRPGAKLLLVDLVLPDENVGMLEAVRDLTMFPVGGMERNETQWRELLAKNGLRIKKIWRGTEPEACVECELLDSLNSE